MTCEINLEEAAGFVHTVDEQWAFWAKIKKKKLARLAQTYDRVKNILEAAIMDHESVGDNQ